VNGGTPARERAEAALHAWVAGAGVESDLGARPGEVVVVLPGEAKLRTAVSILVGDAALTASAFVVRRPDENHEEFYRWLLRRNLRLPGIAFALDPAGDVFVVGRLPVDAVTEDQLDRLLGAVLTASDGAFNELLAIGFVSSMKREWAWRVSRGEPTHNLEAFRHLLEPSSDGTPEAASQVPGSEDRTAPEGPAAAH
jgi:Putative bacterial sensory transduction regulator